MSSGANVSMSLPCFVDGGQVTKQKADLWQMIGFLRLSLLRTAWGRWFLPENNLLCPPSSTMPEMLQANFHRQKCPCLFSHL